MSDKKVAVLTGGAGGIGTEIIRTLWNSGQYKLASTCTVIECERIDNWRKERKLEGVDCELYEVDVSDFYSCQDMIKKVEEDLGPVDVLINVAGITRDATLKKMSLEQWEAVIGVNLDSVFNMTKHVLDGMLERGYGRIINISSMNGRKGQFGQCNYSSAKAGMYGFTMSLAQEVARKGITVNCISPGYIGTAMVMAIDEKIRNQIVAQIPVGRMGYPEEIARTVEFLASKHAGFITGANIDINGGQFMGI
jgi:acetoacetyl-CoA reductase